MILKALGDDPDREGLKETPDRVARMYAEVFEGMNYSNHEIAQMFDYDSMMMVLNSLDKYQLPEGEMKCFSELKEALRKADWDEINSILAGKER